MSKIKSVPAQFHDAKDPCHMCDGTGVIGDYIFSTDAHMCEHCEGTGEEPLHLLPKRRKRTLF